MSMILQNIRARLPKSGDTMTGPLSMTNNKINGLAKQESNNDTASKRYVDDKKKKIPITDSLTTICTEMILFTTDFSNHVNTFL